MKILEVILSFTPWTKNAGWDAVINQLADRAKEDPIALTVKVNDWKQKNIGGTPEQAFKALTGDKTAVLKSTEMPGVDLTKAPPENNGQWIDQGRWWVSKDPILGNDKHEFALKPDLQNPTTWPLPNNNKCPSGEWKAFNGRASVKYSWVLSKDGTTCIPVEKGPNAVNPEVKPVDGKCEKGFKLSTDGKTCIPDGTEVIPEPTTDTPPEPVVDVKSGKLTCKAPWVYDEKTNACVKKADAPKPAPAGETEEQKKARLKKEADAKAAEDKKKEADKKKNPDDNNKVKIIWPAGDASMVNRSNPFNEISHQGIDIKTAVDTDLFAPEAGTITKRDVQEKGAGLYLKLTSTDGKRVHIFMHLSRTLVDTKPPYNVVTQRQLLGTTGGQKGTKFAGNSTGPHLHWGVMENKKWIDPETLIK